MSASSPPPLLQRGLASPDVTFTSGGRMARSSRHWKATPASVSKAAAGPSKSRKCVFFSSSSHLHKLRFRLECLAWGLIITSASGWPPGVARAGARARVDTHAAVGRAQRPRACQHLPLMLVAGKKPGYSHQQRMHDLFFLLSPTI